MNTSSLLPWPQPAHSYNSEQTRLNHKMMTIFNVIVNADKDGVTTRHVSDQCDMSIYSARNWLMKLEEEGHIHHETVGTRKTLWFLNRD